MGLTKKELEEGYKRYCDAVKQNFFGRVKPASYESYVKIRKLAQKKNAA